MKATITILAAVLTLNAGILFAGNEIISAPVTNESFITAIAPITPTEATFEDFNPTTVDIATLAPVTPAVAEFSDSISLTIDINALAPITPAAADFE